MKQSPFSPVAVIGTGIMGRGIAQTLSEKGLSVYLFGRSDTSLNAALAAIQKSLTMDARRKRLEKEEADATAERIMLHTDLAAAKDCSVVLETILEDMAAKQSVLKAVSAHLAPDTLLGSNTSALSLTELASAVSYPERFLGIHFMNPATTVNFVELIRTPATTDNTVAAATAFCKHLKKQYIVVNDSPGFVVNRLLMLLINEAARMIEEGVASPREIDKAMRLACGHPMGPAALADFIGIDTVCAELKNIATKTNARYTPSALLEHLLAAGHLGRKSGKGLLATDSTKNPEEAT